MTTRPRPWEVSRRACLRGAGAAIGLPVLEAMLPGINRARAAGASTPKRLVVFVFTGGIPDCTYNTTGPGTAGNTGAANPGPGSFWPRPSTPPGPSYEPTRILQPLADAGLKQDILLIRNLHNMSGETADDGKGNKVSGGHGQASNALLTGEVGIYPNLPADGETVTRAGTSVDQIAANHFKKETPALPYLFLSNPVHPDFKFQQTISWSDPTTKAPGIVQPPAAFRAVFGDNTVDAKALQKRIDYRLGVLHHAKASVDRLKRKLGQADLQRLNKYLQSVADLETRVMASGNLNQCATPGTPPPDTMLMDNSQPCSDADSCYAEHAHKYQIDVPAHFQQMSEIIVHAFQCDRTRVAVVHVFTHALSFKWLGPPCDQFADWHGDIEHGASEIHDSTGANRIETAIRGCTSEVAQFAYLVKRLKETEEGGGTLLDNCALACTSELSNGSGHNMRHLPVIVAGGAGGLVKKGQGRYVVMPDEQPIYNLWVTMLNALGVKDSAGADITRVGSGSTGPLSLG